MNWQTVGPALLVSNLERLPIDSELPQALRECEAAFTDHVAQFGAPGTIDRFEALLRVRSLPRDVLRASLARHFTAVIRNASRSSFRKLVDLLLVMRRLDLDAHATIAGILLPADPEFLAQLVTTRAPAYVATYLAECFKANKSALSSRIGNPKKRAIFVDAFWTKFGAGAPTSKRRIRSPRSRLSRST